ncbi:methyltransferase domain-containing protein [Conexibacter sp. JD483]|uniref:methyltransferase domain-containing protein n=1 Tax=unclassified Conexibacter TaxID=2627773 RepID=UPI0027258642|nr:MULTISPECIES: methyltransferase domain-containing protein [unclassified Conexibacter]MDO8184887.1 methyltransferase domain-containing protein [Conexibacter sp. CPCC 205706]MDO8196662.1 methyltransferase domain-containing protein [Conexibacter sp. CPCC 205762]MDR9371957.1 methyltransferase domain-containing protein [Conexibacter sp. JD483]
MTNRATSFTSAVFESHAGSYADALRQRLIPPFDAFYGTAVGALSELDTPPRAVLDLGAGTGLLSGFVLQAFPDAALTLVDGAPAMLDQARSRLAAAGAEATFVIGDLADPLPGADAAKRGSSVADGGADDADRGADDADGGADDADRGAGWDAIVSALAIHHLDDAGKEALFARILAALRPGGIFVNAEQVLGRTPAIQARYRAWHRAESARLGTTAEEWAASEERMKVDQWATVADQIAWLEQAGFADADAPFGDHCFAVLVARKPG